MTCIQKSLGDTGKGTLIQKLSISVVLNQILITSLEDIPLETQLQRFLEIILGLSWFSLMPKGAVFLVDKHTRNLKLISQQGFSEEHIKRCSTIEPGECLCGSVMESGKFLFTCCVQSQHTIDFDVEDHGHYIVPITNKTLLGTICLYVTPNHKMTVEQKEFLTVIATTIANIIERKHLETRLKTQSEYDKLTGLPNRSLFNDRLDQSLIKAERNGEQVVLMFIDLDKFKYVNDTLGHMAGDLLLKKVAKRILKCIRSTDTVARLGGDEFVVILTGITHIYYVELVARKILQQLETPFTLNDDIANISGSLGITIYPDDCNTFDDCISSADTAMYQAKNGGRANFCFFKAEMNNQALERIELERSILKGIEQQEFYLVYQPKLSLILNKIESVEALVRWKHNGKIITPDKFIPAAEETGVIISLGAYVLETACKQIQEWVSNGLEIRLAVNLSARQFQKPDAFLSLLRDSIIKYRFDPKYLELEITESMMVTNTEVSIKAMDYIRCLGVHLSVDDFGTGYSSLGCLRKFPVQTLKIDRSLVSDDSLDGKAIVKAILHIGHTLGLTVVAEGVETKEQLDFLRENKCDTIQGYYFSRPVSPKEIVDKITVGREKLYPAYVEHNPTCLDTLPKLD